MMNKNNLVKVLYIIPEGEEDAGVAEGLWAFPLGNQLYELLQPKAAIGAFTLRDQDVLH
jgi:hypothetical protein